MTGPRPDRCILLALPLAILLAVGAALVLAGRGSGESDAEPGGPIGLFTSLPILWREAPDLSGFLDSDAPPHWSLAVIERHGELKAIDTLAPDGGSLPLPADGVLILAQPRPLSPQENVALDDWVKGGGHLLLFADPLLTSHSAYALGDIRRPQDVVLLSPILARWGLALSFDEDQPFGERGIELFGATLPVNLPGGFTVVSASAGCSVEADGVAAQCRIGKGRVLAIADAALLEEGSPEDRRQRGVVLDRLLARLGRPG